MSSSTIIDAKEFDAADKEAQNTPYTYTHTFNSPFEFEGQTYEELTFDFTTLTGKDSLAIENEMLSLGKPLISPELSGEYLIRVAAKACTAKIGTDVLEAMPMADYNKIRNRARSFLLRSGS